jgi:fumarylacetoacetate (FAA) hydrolase
MRLATLADGTRDGCLIVVSPDAQRYFVAEGIAATLQAALDDWIQVEAALRALDERLRAGQGLALDTARLLAPLPRAWQWLDGSAYPNHGELMQKAFGLPPIESSKPLMYQGMSHTFLSATQDVPFPSEADGIDFEGEFGVITGDVPMGCTAEEALDLILFVVLINDWSLRTIAPVEMKTGFGWVQAKPACSLAPFAISLDEIAGSWKNGRIDAFLKTYINGVRFGDVPAAPEMAFGFHDLVAHAARTRSLPAGTIIGSGTVSSKDYAQTGSSCLSELRAIDVINGKTPTPFLAFGDRVMVSAHTVDGVDLGALDQRVVKAGG